MIEDDIVRYNLRGIGCVDYQQAEEEAAMNRPGVRQLVYTALFILCAPMALATGPTAGIWSFLIIGAVIELAYWIGTPRGGYSGRRG